MIAFLRRVGFFILMNFAVMILLGVIMSTINIFFPWALNFAGGMGSIFLYALVIWFGWAFISLFLSRWMAKSSYGIQVLIPEKMHEAHPKLRLVYETVERIALSHHIQMPEVGYYESPEPNAFATGATKNSSLVAVSTGLLNAMDDREVAGVIGHEMAHVLNGDMVTMTLLQWVLNTFVVFLAHIVARIVASFLEKDRENALSYFAYNALYMVFQMVFGFLALLVMMWYSRAREYRADLGWAQFTSKANMIAGLKKLKSITELQKFPTMNHGNLKAFMITEPDGFLSTHPSLANRIKALEENYQLP